MKIFFQRLIDTSTPSLGLTPIVIARCTVCFYIIVSAVKIKHVGFNEITCGLTLYGPIELRKSSNKAMRSY